MNAAPVHLLSLKGTACRHPPYGRLRMREGARDEL